MSKTLVLVTEILPSSRVSILIFAKVSRWSCGRNGAGKTTVIKAILGDDSMTRFSGDITLDRQMRIGVYEQEVSNAYFNLPLMEAIERMYLDRNLSISDEKIRGLLSSYLFNEGDGRIPLAKLSGGQRHVSSSSLCLPMIHSS